MITAHAVKNETTGEWFQGPHTTFSQKPKIYYSKAAADWRVKQLYSEANLWGGRPWCKLDKDHLFTVVDVLILEGKEKP